MLLLLVALVAAGLYADRTRRRWREWAEVDTEKRDERAIADAFIAHANKHDDAGDPGWAAESRT